MNLEEIIKVENELKVKFPAFYKSQLLNFPAELIYDDPDDESVYHSVVNFIEATKFLRQISSEGGGDFPENMIAIGTNGGGDFFSVKEDDVTQIIYILDHEDGSIKTASLEEFIAKWTEEKMIWD